MAGYIQIEGRPDLHPPKIDLVVSGDGLGKDDEHMPVFIQFFLTPELAKTLRKYLDDAIASCTTPRPKGRLEVPTALGAGTAKAVRDDGHDTDA